jgi:HEAT repeat protein
MTTAEIVWWFSMMLAFSAIGVLLVLILRRYQDEMHEQWEATRATEVLLTVFCAMELMEAHMDNWTDVCPQFSKKDKNLAIKLTLHLCHLIKGRERDSLTRLLVQLGARKQAHLDLKHKNLKTRLDAVNVLQLFNDRSSVFMLIKSLNDEAPEVVMSAADALHELKALPPAYLLASKLEARGLLNSHDARNLFRDIARRKPGSLVKMAKKPDISQSLKQVLADAMGHALDFSVIDGLSALSRDEMPSVRRQAIESLGALEHPGAEQTIRAALVDDNWLVRLEAIKSAGRIGLNQTADIIAGFLNDANWDIRFQAAQTLAQLGNRGVNLLRQHAKEADPAGLMAASVLGEHNLDSHCAAENPSHA